ncbi:carboxylesterase/lipase family protein [Streptomyces sp. NPDC085639]|uniref:carboxylesterase/lipase family protein n=1 Tax=Streptomyces sp. NPDC085639 TaxID=3365734 RepID=UPI0037D8A066
MRKIALVLCSALLLAPLTATIASAQSPQGGTPNTVKTKNGWVRGESTVYGRQFLGIPYAKPPVGNLRLAPPSPASSWQGVKDARHFGNSCPQNKNPFSSPDYDNQTRSEACLDLNVYTPPTRDGEKLPVMVFIHGGANTGGQSPDVVPDEFARKAHAVVVTINYRLGVLGFLTLPGTTGNFALLDQRQAFRWVRDNAGAFGGDGKRVTIAGQSAGGIAVCTHLASPGSRGLFRAAIIQSGSIGDCGAVPRQQAESTSLAVAAAAGCTTPSTVVSCMRGKPVQEILDAQDGPAAPRPYWQYSLGTELPEQPLAAFTAGHASNVPVMNGGNSSESLVSAYLAFDAQGVTLTPDAFPEALTDAFGPQVGSQALPRYPLSDFTRPVYAYAAALGDQFFACPVLRTNVALGQRGKVYSYEFADRTSPALKEPSPPVDFNFGASHSAELNYLYRPYSLSASLNPEQRQLADQMIKYWGSFVHGKTPQVNGQPDMPQYQNGRVLQLRTQSAGGNIVSTALRAEHRCDLWDAFS